MATATVASNARADVVVDEGRGGFELRRAADDWRARIVGRPVGLGARAVATDGTHVVWINDAGTKSSIMISSSRKQRVFVPATEHYLGQVLITHKSAFWTEGRDVMREAIDGGESPVLVRSLPVDGASGDVASGLASDGRTLFFSQCISGRIGAVPLATNGTTSDVHWFSGIHCPQAIVVFGGYLYWADGESTEIGRLDLATGSSDPIWLSTDGGVPDELAIAAGHIFWTYSTGSGRSARSYVARARLDGTAPGERLWRVADTLLASPS